LVPAAYGGTWRDESGYAEYPEYVCQSPVKILPQHYYDQDLLWQKHGFTKLPLLNFENIKAMKTFEIKKTCKSNMQTLLWHFTVSSDVEFSIVKIDQDGNEAIAWPKITLMSLKAPEQGSITCNPGEYVIRFTNPSRFWLPVKLYFVVSLCPKNV
ncbi:unnamed protein product, partial [Thelazia callipaeda]|uniref:Calpain_III domain-containing protein n=1 Tax=Thelazia callipaeda TaxID=103827 RepID=A0A0N5CQ91_THECL